MRKLSRQKKIFSSLSEVNKVTTAVVRAAAQRLKHGKSDPYYSFSSDCIKNSPDELFNLISILLKEFLMHGHVSFFLLLATLVPIIKNKGSNNSSKNYRLIAISSLVLKLLDWVILLLYGERLQLDDLQYAYQQQCSTTMCTWGVLENVG